MTEPPASSRPPAESPSLLPTAVYTQAFGQFAPGQILGNRYRITALLGRGGMGEVWQAYDLKLQVDVALKSMRPERFPGEEGLELLRREVRAAREVMSPNVCRIFDLVDEEGQEFVSMEYVDGATLLEVLRNRGPLELSEATRISSQFLLGLEAIHQVGLVHRDVKPENIMITRTGRVVLMDFGVAKGIAEDHRGTIAGTPAYMAPEQLRGEALDARADIFAAGVVLAEMIAPEGVREHKSRESIWHSVRQTPVQLFESPWRGVLERALAGERSQRYGSAREFARALEEVTLRVEGAEDKRPYPGLESFTEADAEFFFGRELEVEAVWKKLQRTNLLAIIGPSGAGKTSFLQAGLLPSKPANWQYVLLRPGSAPFAALAQSLAPELAGDAEAVRDLVQIERPERGLAAVGRWRRRYSQVLIIVDQFEELFALCGPETQAGFADFLGRLASEADVHVLLSMRDDFLFHCHGHARLGPISSDLTMLGPPTGDALRRALVQPALLCGYRFEDETLVEQMLASVEGERGALPLLAFAAARLWEKRERERGVLTREAYEQIGGVSGALAQHAEATLERIGSERLPLVRELIRNLVTAHGTRAMPEVEELLSIFPERNAAEEVLNALIDARLLTSFEIAEIDAKGAKRGHVEIVHESLLTRWPRLVHWQTQDAEGAQLRDQLRQAAQLWKEHNKSADMLWTGSAYKEFELWHERYPGRLTETEEAFGLAMGSRARRDRRKRRIALGVAFTMLLIVIAVISWYGRRERLARLGAEAGKLMALGREVLAENPSIALAYAIASLEQVDTPAGRRLVMETLSRGPIVYVMPTEIQPHGLSFSPDGKWLVVAGWMGIQAVSSDGSQSIVVEEHHSNSMRGTPQFAQDNDRMAWRDARDPNLIRVWSLSSGSDVRRLRMAGGTTTFARGHQLLLRTIVSQNPWTFELRTWAYDDSEPLLISRYSTPGWDASEIDPSGQWMAYAKDGGVYVSALKDLDLGRGRLIGKHPTKMAGVTFDAKGERIASADTSGEVRIWSVHGDQDDPLCVLRGRGAIRNLQFNLEGNLFAAVCGPQSQICLWDLEGPHDAEPVILRMPWSGGFPSINPQFRFDPTGRWIAAAYIDKIVFWQISRPDHYVLRSPPGQPGLGFDATFMPNGELLVADFLNGPLMPDSARVWVQDLSGGPLRMFPKATGHGAARLRRTLRFDSHGRLWASSNTGLYLMSLVDGPLRQMPTDPPNASIGRIAASPDGRFVAASRIDQKSSILVWDLGSDSVRVLERSKGTIHNALTFLADGSLVSGDQGGNVQRWDIQDGKSTLIKEVPLPFIGDIAGTSDPGELLVTAFASGSWEENTAGVVGLLELETKTWTPIASRGTEIVSAILDSAKTLLVTTSVDGSVLVGSIGDEETHMTLLRRPGVRSISPDGRWILLVFQPNDRETLAENQKMALCVLRRPEGRPLHRLRGEELLGYLRGLTNLRVAPDRTTHTGYRVTPTTFLGWTKPPSS